MVSDSDDDAVGYRRPPKDGRFKKGQSGNPHGRPKRVSNLKDDLAAELRQTLVFTENGKERRITKQQAFVKTLTAAAIKKDIRAVTVLLACMRQFGVGAELPASENSGLADLADLEVLESYVRQQREHHKRAENSTTEVQLKPKTPKQQRS